MLTGRNFRGTGMHISNEAPTHRVARIQFDLCKTDMDEIIPLTSCIVDVWGHFHGKALECNAASFAHCFGDLLNVQHSFMNRVFIYPDKLQAGRIDDATPDGKNGFFHPSQTLDDLPNITDNNFNFRRTVRLVSGVRIQWNHILKYTWSFFTSISFFSMF